MYLEDKFTLAQDIVQNELNKLYNPYFLRLQLSDLPQNTKILAQMYVYKLIINIVVYKSTEGNPEEYVKSLGC